MKNIYRGYRVIHSYQVILLVSNRVGGCFRLVRFVGALTFFFATDSLPACHPSHCILATLVFEHDPRLVVVRGVWVSGPLEQFLLMPCYLGYKPVAQKHWPQIVGWWNTIKKKIDPRSGNMPHLISFNYSRSTSIGVMGWEPSKKFVPFSLQNIQYGEVPNHWKGAILKTCDFFALPAV